MFLQSFSALVLGVTLYAPTYKQGPILSLLALSCRVAEAIQSGESAIYFAVNSLIFSLLLLRGKLIPVALAQIGVVASVLLVVVLPLQLAGLFVRMTHVIVGLDHLAGVAADAGVRGSARAVADDQKRQHGTFEND